MEQGRAAIRVYDAARYGKYIYEGAAQAALGDADAPWAAEVLVGRA